MSSEVECRLLVAVPSRGRPGDVRRLLGAMEATISADTKVIFGFDDDDPELAANQAATAGCSFAGAIVAARRSQTDWANGIAALAAPNCEAVALLSDDNVPVTVGWDQQMLSALSQPRVLMTYADDQDGNKGCSHIAMSSRAILALGWLAEPTMRHYFIDNVWDELGRRTGTIWFLANCAIDHVWRPGRAPEDQLRREELTWFQHDKQAYATWLAERADADAQKLMELAA